MSRTPIAVVTDSAADVPEALRQRHHIQVVPAILVVGERSFLDGKGMSREDFYRGLPAMARPPTTASPSPEMFAEVYRAALGSGAEQILSIHVSGRLSGIPEMARRAAESFDGRVQVIDTGQVSLGAGFQVLAAAQAATAGLPMEDILAVVDDVHRRLRVVAMIDNLEYLRRSGRVDWLRSSLSSLLHIRVLVDLADGIVRRRGQVRSRPRAIEALERMAQAWGPIDQLGVLHSSALADARAMAARLAARVANEPLVVDVTTIIGTHVGPHSLGLVAVLADGSLDARGRTG